MIVANSLLVIIFAALAGALTIIFAGVPSPTPEEVVKLWIGLALLTTFIGSALGGLAFIALRGLKIENGYSYPIVGTILATLATSVFVEFDSKAISFLVPGTAIVGLIMGIGFWKLIRRPMLTRRNV